MSHGSWNILIYSRINMFFLLSRYCYSSCKLHSTTLDRSREASVWKADRYVFFFKVSVPYVVFDFRLSSFLNFFFIFYSRLVVIFLFNRYRPVPSRPPPPPQPHPSLILLSYITLCVTSWNRVLRFKGGGVEGGFRREVGHWDKSATVLRLVINCWWRSWGQSVPGSGPSRCSRCFLRRLCTRCAARCPGWGCWTG